jgi:NitT/TauT family transport system permease protein
MIGYFLSIIVGISLAIVIVYFRTIERILFPIMLGANAIPKVAIAPILVIWMGFGTEPKVAMVFLLCFFPIILSTAAGLKSTPAELTELLQSMSATPLQSFLKLRFPYALPQIFVGLKVAISLAVIGAVVGEFVGAKVGLGYIIVISGSNADTSLAFASMVLLSVMAIILFYSLVLLEKWLLPWAEENK